MTRKRLAIAGIALAVIAVAVWLWSGGALRRRPPTEERAVDRSTPAAREANPRDRAPVDLRKLPRGSISGRVTSRGGAPVAGATVCGSMWSEELSSEDRAEPLCTTTGADGSYRLADLLPASYWLSASAPTFIPARYTAADKPSGRRGDAGRLLLRAGDDLPGIDIVLSPGGVEVHGIVRDIGGGAIASAQVSLTTAASSSGGWSVTRTADDGTFSGWIAPGPMYATASAPGYTGGWRQAIAPGQRIEILLTPESVIAGTVIEHGTGKPVPRARVSVTPGWGGAGMSMESDGSALTDDEGRFRITRLEPGRYKPEASKAGGWGKARQSVLLGVGETVEGVVIELHPAYVVTGAIRIAGDKTPCTSGTLTLTDDENGRRLSGWTENRDGRVEIDAVLPGEYDVEISCDGYLEQDEYPDLVVTDEDLLDQVWEVAIGGTIRGVVKTASGASVAHANVSAGVSGGDPRAQRSQGWGETDLEGRFELTGLVAGKYDVEVHARDHVELDEPREVELATAGEVEIEIVLSAGGDLRGGVVDQDGKPVSGAHVQLEGSARPMGWRDGTQTRDDGSFELTGIRPGSYRATASTEQWGATLRRPGSTDDDVQGTPVDIADGQVTTAKLVVESRSGRISGRVVDPAGAAVTDAFVSVERESDAAGASASSARRAVRWQWNRKPALTDMDGKFTVDQLSPGTYTVHAHRRGGGEAVADKVSPGGSVTLTIADVATIGGTVAGGAGEIPAEFTISIDDRKGGFSRNEKFFRTGGQWKMEDLPAGTFSISVSCDLGNGGVTGVTLAEGEDKTGVQLRLEAQATVTGRLVALDTGEPVPGMQVRAQPLNGRNRWRWGGGDKQQITDASGSFRIEDAAAGRAYITAWPLDWDRAAFSFARVLVTLEPGKTNDVGALKIPRRRIDTRTEKAGDLGFTLKEIDPDVEPEQRVLEVALVRPDGPAARSGLRAGDVISSVDGHDVRGANSYLYWSLSGVSERTQLVLGLARGDSVHITAGKPL